MCSQVSQVLDDYRDALLAAVTEVAEKSLFAFADFSDRAAFDAAAAPLSTDRDWLRAGIRFTGPIDGQFALVVPAGLARRLCAAFAGAEAPDDVGEDDVIDFTGELANMVCGTWLTRTWRHEAFSLTPPRVLHCGPGRKPGVEPARSSRVAARAVRRSPAGTADTGSLYLAIDDTPIRLEIDWDVAAPTASAAIPERADAR
jgi:hypothetical protein